VQGEMHPEEEEVVQQQAEPHLRTERTGCSRFTPDAAHREPRTKRSGHVGGSVGVLWGIGLGHQRAECRCLPGERASRIGPVECRQGHKIGQQRENCVPWRRKVPGASMQRGRISGARDGPALLPRGGG
jgi:hypothetical protein